MGEKQSNLLWFLFAGVLLVAFFELFLVQPQVATIPYSDFKMLLAAGKVTEATIGQDTIRALIDLRGTDKLLPAAEYKQIEEVSSARGSSL
ncbi:MAG TPA: ATP-dependent metallopeptidase FtsH/Yme1/Tma family protein, partial [Steroidobacteraceae bacterium]|nr:ATP-dependent metallopeptidase FtsH/Yme1/Tma family protein [Steroidobacteraceae bacterium]